MGMGGWERIYSFQFSHWLRSGIFFGTSLGDFSSLHIFWNGDQEETTTYPVVLSLLSDIFRCFLLCLKCCFAISAHFFTSIFGFMGFPTKNSHIFRHFQCPRGSPYQSTRVSFMAHHGSPYEARTKLSQGHGAKSYSLVMGGLVTLVNLVKTP